MEGVCIPLHSSPDANLRFFVSSPSDSEMVFVLASQHQGSSLVFPKAVWRTDAQSAENWHLLLSGLETNSAGRQEVVGLAPNNHTGHFHMERPRDLHGGRKKKKTTQRQSGIKVLTPLSGSGPRLLRLREHCSDHPLKGRSEVSICP